MGVFLTLLAISAGLGASLAGGSPGKTSAAINQPFTLSKARSVTVATSKRSKVRLALTSVYDSRCPSTTTCIWAGYAAVHVTLTDASLSAQQVHISLGYKGDPALTADSVLVTLNQGGYWLRLLAVQPPPGTATASRPKTVTLRLRPS